MIDLSWRKRPSCEHRDTHMFSDYHEGRGGWWEKCADCDAVVSTGTHEMPADPGERTLYWGT